MFLLDFISLFALSYILVAMLRIIPSVCEKIALSLAVMFVLKSLSVYCLIAVGAKPDMVLQASLSVFALLIGGGFYWFRTGKVHALEEALVVEPDRNSVIAVVAVMGVLWGFSLMNALFFPITEGDGVWHEIRGARFFYERSLDLEAYQYNSYAPFLHLIYVYLISINVDKLKIVFPLFYLCLMVICYHRLLAYHKNQKIAAAFTLVLGTTPYFWWHSVLPYLNLATGFYFASAAIYWFFLIDSLVKDPKGNQISKMVSLALLSGWFFSVAAWVRLEFFLYDIMPFAGLVYVLEQRTQLEQNQKRKIIFAFTVTLLSLPFLWLMTTMTFKASHGIHIYGPVVACVLVALCATLFAIGALRMRSKITSKTILYGLAFIALLFIVILSTKGPKTVSPGQAVLLGLYRTIFFNVFFSCTLFLAGFLFSLRLGELQGAIKYLGIFLLAYLLMHFAIYTFNEPKWTVISAYIDATFVHFGNSVNSSGTREMLAFYPAFIFFIASLPQVRELMKDRLVSKAKGLVYAVVVLNLLVLLVVFIYPRAKFMSANRSLTSAELMETSGVPDMPNSAREVYGMLNRIRDATDSAATIFFPPLEGAHRSHPLQRLYPRKLFWGDLPGYEENMGKIQDDSYFVSRSDWYPEYCANKPKVMLNSNVWMCRMNDAGK